MLHTRQPPPQREAPPGNRTILGQVQGLQEQLKRCEEDLKHTMTQRNYFKGYFDKCCGRDMLRHNTNLPLNLEMINNNHEQQDFKR